MMEEEQHMHKERLLTSLSTANLVPVGKSFGANLLITCFVPLTE